MIFNYFYYFYNNSNNRIIITIINYYYYDNSSNKSLFQLQCHIPKTLNKHLYNLRYPSKTGYSGFNY